MYCKLVNTGSTSINIDAGRTVEKSTTVNCTDEERFHSLFDHAQEIDPPPLSSDGVTPSLSRKAEGDTTERREIIVDISEANFGQISAPQKWVLLSILGTFKELFPSDRNRVPPWNMKKLRLLLEDENCTPEAVR